MSPEGGSGRGASGTAPPASDSAAVTGLTAAPPPRPLVPTSGRRPGSGLARRTGAPARRTCHVPRPPPPGGGARSPPHLPMRAGSKRQEGSYFCPQGLELFHRRRAAPGRGMTLGDRVFFSGDDPRAGPTAERCLAAALQQPSRQPPQPGNRYKDLEIPVVQTLWNGAVGFTPRWSSVQALIQ
ncbi:translation initiation factor IF-2-like isoform X2 [Equus quagga]|uniref:translation initiation factor IF-2-like isoform X2 n=1 Tax=Equus quagga TaxID=89248 RepID=UPI001D04181A|nr:translation initiation factor IF-2-like isoform X2 [Equus asinus]XP_046530432.1 translation initiation factor IF-2-like isoform X2 [Equus quagga]